MIEAASKIRAFFRDSDGSVLIETAFIAPLLILMTLAGVEISSIIAKQTELQTLAANAQQIIISASPENETELVATIEDVKEYIVAESKLTFTSSDTVTPGQVRVVRRYRCGNNSTRQATYGCANTAQTISSYVVIDMSTNYVPVWVNYGIGHEMTFKVRRAVQVG